MHEGIRLECGRVAAHEPLHPKSPELGTSMVPFMGTIYIKPKGFRLEDLKDCSRLAPRKLSAFRSTVSVACTSCETDPAAGSLIGVVDKLENTDSAMKPKVFIQWVAEYAPSRSPLRVEEARIFHQLFKSDNRAASQGYLANNQSG